MDMQDAIRAAVLSLASYQKALASGMSPDVAMRACGEGWVIGKLSFILDNIAAAQRMLRDGNVSGAQMFLDMCDDPRKETK